MKNHKPFISLSSTLLLLLLVGCNNLGLEDNLKPRAQSNNIANTGISTPTALHESASVAVDWYNLQLKMILRANPALSNILTIRIFGYEGISLYETVRHGIPNSVSLSSQLYQMPAMPEKENNMGYSWTLAANAALAYLVRNTYPASLVTKHIVSIDSLEAAYNNSGPDIDSKVFARSQAYGRAVAKAIIDWSASDNFNHANDPYTIPVFPGSWEKTPPAFANPAVPYFGNNRTFLQEYASGNAPAFPIDYSEEPTSDFYAMVKDLYDVSKSLTPEEKAIALYWNDVGVGRGYTPAGHGISVINQILTNNHASLGLAAEAYAKAGIAYYDAAVLCWKGKYTFNVLRPVTYINKFIDPNWLPLIPTPPHPEYPAAHAYVTGSMMQAITSVFGDNYTFTDHTYDFLGYAPRSYSSLNEMGTESGNSRRYGGIHYAPSIAIGLELGRKIGKRVGEIKFVDEPASY